MTIDIMQLENFYGRKWEITRLPTGKFRIGKKKYLTPKQVDLLFDGEVVIEEKLDGKQLAKKIDHFEVGGPLVLYGEYLRDTRSIFYDRLPGWFVLWDILDLSDRRMLELNERKRIATRLGIPIAPVIFEGRTTFDEALKLLIQDSKFGSSAAEGIVIKNYKRQLFGKIVRPEFIEGIEREGNYIRRRGPHLLNRLDIDKCGHANLK